MNSKNLWILIVGLFCFLGIDQSFAQNRELKQLVNDLNGEYIKDSLAVAEYLRTHGGTKRNITKSGRVSELVKVVNGRPIYKIEDNSGAARTTRVDEVYSGGDLGLDLSGEGHVVGVWDGGHVKHDHVEFDGRLTFGDGGSTVGSHGTHVMGTIIATGINASAKGMAYKATGKSYIWDNDLTEMASFALTGATLSNHSYGTRRGWDDGIWFGDASISEDEDYKFGFYGFDAPAIDNIARNAPYYLSVKSAGNDRNDSGSGHPPDGNSGTGFDTIGPAGTAKNNLTVGAIQKFSQYTGPEDVLMSTFSSWGPTDDGRIKPDIVGAGVGLLSTGSSSTDTYYTSSGTSMAAPNVTGSLLLLQEHFSNLNSGEYMKSSTLKGLAIHTASEAGLFDGPDYKFGWGVLDVAKAAEHISNADTDNNMLIETSLNDGEELIMPLFPKKNTWFVATICWTDPAGPGSALALDPPDLRLVNDLDIVIEDDAGNQFLPWILDPSNPAIGATKGNNFRDNVEKIEFNVPAERKYTLKVSHKNSIVDGTQDFALIITQTSVADGLVSYHYIGEDGIWDNPNNWSLVSGGLPSNAIPSENDNVVFDENSFKTSESLTLPSDLKVNSISWFANDGKHIDLQNQSLKVGGSLIIGNKVMNPFINGHIEFSTGPSTQKSLHSGNSMLSQARFLFDANVIEVGASVSTPFDLRSVFLDLNEELIVEVEDAILSNANSQLRINSGAKVTIQSIGDIEFQGTVHIENGELEIVSQNSFKKIVLNDRLMVADIIQVDSLFLLPKSVLTLSPSHVFSVQDYLQVDSGNGIETSILSSESSLATFKINSRAKYCFDHLIINNVGLTGESAVSVGLNSSVTNGPNWLPISCNDILFAEFNAENFCVSGMTNLNDLSSGLVGERTWEIFKSGNSISTSSDSVVNFSFTELGEYQIELTVQNELQTNTVSKSITIIENHLDPNTIVDNETSLASLKSAPEYQWYKDDLKIEGANERVYIVQEENTGNYEYFVVTADDVCNRKSEILLKIILSVSEEELEEEIMPGLYPNPAKRVLNITIPEMRANKATVSVVSSSGITKISTTETVSNQKIALDINSLANGLYTVIIELNGNVYRDKFLVDK